MTDAPIPLVDLSWQHRQIAKKVEKQLTEVMEAGDFIRGSAVTAFESRYAAYCGVKHCVGVGNGTDALELSMRALGIGAGDEVVVPANSFIASALAIVRTAATPVLVDCEPERFLIDPEAVAAAMTTRTKAVMPVHLYGQLVDIESLRRVTGVVAIVEDAAQAHGATMSSGKSSSVGEIAGTSFYPGKNLGAYGDAGAILTNDAQLAERVRALGNWGSLTKYHHPLLGFNSRLDSVQAVVLSAKLEELDHWNQLRAEAADRYREFLDGNEAITLPRPSASGRHVWHIFVVQVSGRDEVVRAMHNSGIGVGVHYPLPTHMQGALSFLGYQRGDFPASERLADACLSLPLFPGITPSQQERVSHSLVQAVRDVSTSRLG